MYNTPIYFNHFKKASYTSNFNYFLNCFFCFLGKNFSNNSIFYVLDSVITSEISKIDKADILYIDRLKTEYIIFFRNVKTCLNIIYQAAMPEDFEPLSSGKKIQYPDIVDKYLNYYFSDKNKELIIFNNRF